MRVVLCLLKMPTALSRSVGVWQWLCWLNVLITVCLLNTVGAVWHIMRVKSAVQYVGLEPRRVLEGLDPESIYTILMFSMFTTAPWEMMQISGSCLHLWAPPLCVSHLWARGQLAAREAPDHYSDVVYMQCKWLVNKQRRTEPHVPPGRPCSLCKSAPTALSARMRQEIKSWG